MDSGRGGRGAIDALLAEELTLRENRRIKIAGFHFSFQPSLDKNRVMASLTQLANELRSAFDWLNANGAEHGIAGPIIVTGWSAGGHLTALLLDHPRVAAGLSISGVLSSLRSATPPKSMTKSN